MADTSESVAGRAALKSFSKTIRGYTLLAQVIAFASSLLIFVPYWALFQLGNELLEGADKAHIYSILELLFAAFILRLFLYVVALSITHVGDLKLRRHIERSIMEKISRIPIAWLIAKGSGCARKLVQDDAATVHVLVAHAPVDVLLAVMNPLVLFIFTLWLDWRLALIATVSLILYVFCYMLTTRGMQEKTVIMDKKLGRIAQSMIEFVVGISVVKSFGKTGEAHRSYKDAVIDFTDFYTAWCKPLILAGAISNAWIVVPTVIFINVFLSLLFIGNIPVVALVTSTIIAMILPENVQTVTSIVWSYQLAGAAAVRIKEMLDEPEVSFGTRSELPQNFNVVFEHINYSYGQVQAIKDLSLTLPEGSVSALIGPSGSGKSTLASLLVRFDDPSSGRICIGGIDIREFSRETLYTMVAFVLQDPQILELSIYDNILLGKPDATKEELFAAAKAAHIHEEILALERGYDSICGKDVRLSGGQQQRVAIARALLKGAPILVLDEATAMADPESEAEIQRALSELARNKTVLVVAHRVSSVIGSDQFIVMDTGEIAACGSAQDVMSNSSARKLFDQLEATTC